MHLIAPQILGVRLERPKNTVKSRTARMYPAWVLGLKPRIVMSSIMRRRNGLMGLSVMGLLLS